MKNERDVHNVIEFELFEKHFQNKVDYNTLNKNSIKEDIKDHFNLSLLKAKEEGASILGILTFFTEHYIEPQSIAKILNSRIMSEFRKELKNNIFIKKTYFKNSFIHSFASGRKKVKNDA